MGGVTCHLNKKETAKVGRWWVICLRTWVQEYYDGFFFDVTSTSMNCQDQGWEKEEVLLLLFSIHDWNSGTLVLHCEVLARLVRSVNYSHENLLRWVCVSFVYFNLSGCVSFYQFTKCKLFIGEHLIHSTVNFYDC